MESQTSLCPAQRQRRRFLYCLCAAIALTALYLFAAASTRGLRRTVYGGTEQPASVLSRRLTAYVGVDFLREYREFPRTSFRITWDGVWYVPKAGVYEVHTQADDYVIVSIDGSPIVQDDTGPRPAISAQSIALDKGPHQLAVDYLQTGDAYELRVFWSLDGSGPRPFGQTYLYPSVSVARWHGPLVLFGWLVLGVWIALPFVLIVARIRASPTLAAGARENRGFGLPFSMRSGLVFVIVLYAALLRCDALISTRGDISGPRWMEAVQRRVQTIATVMKPAGLAWQPEPYPVGGDPYDTLQQAREMSSPYAAHLREPLFAFATKITLQLSGQDDLAVCLTSAFFSILAVYATYLLGSYAFSPLVGLLAGTAMAIEGEVIFWGVAGWRDDMFTCLSLFSAYAFLRLAREPGVSRSVVAGAVGAGACLVRITSLSFLLPSLLYVGLSRSSTVSKTRLKSAIICGATTCILVAPFLFNSWVRFGDPFYSVNALTRFYAQDQDQPDDETQGWLPWIDKQAFRRPADLIDAVVVGSTLYPFRTKWHGFDAWSSPLFSLAGVLSGLAVLGIVLWPLSPSGRFLVLVLLTAQAPFVFTKGTPSAHDFRHTVHTYPFFLIAAAYAAEQFGSEIRKITASRRVLPTAKKVGIVLTIGCLGWTVLHVLPYFTTRENLRGRRATAVVAGSRDWVFFRNDWYEPMTVGNVTARFAKGRKAALQIPLIANESYSLRMRIDPFVYDGFQQQIVAVRLNGAPLGILALHANPERVGTYSLAVPPSIVKDGLNRLEFVAAYSTHRGSVVVTSSDKTFDSLVPADQDVAFRIWYVLIRPLGTDGSSDLRNGSDGVSLATTRAATSAGL